MVLRPTRIPNASLASLLLVTLSICPLRAQTQVTLGALKDNTLYESSAGDLSNGAGQHFFAGRTNQTSSSIRRGLLAFDVAGSIPSGATITQVTLTLNMSQTSSGDQTVSLHRALADWGKGTSQASGNEGGGAPATAGDATWLHTFYPTTMWSTAGGDYSGTPSASLTVGTLGTYTWNSTSQLVDDVQQWLNTPSSNFGWVLVGNESASSTSKRFDSKDNATPGLRPSLTVTYTPPTSVAEEAMPADFSLEQNYPNPFNPSTTVEFRVAKTGLAEITVYDVLGRDVAALVSEVLSPGSYSITWNASGISSGVYLYRLRTGEFTQTKRMVLLR